MLRVVVSTLVAVSLMSCAKSADKVGAQYTSPLLYQSYDCIQLELEYSRVNRRVVELTGKQDDAAAGDAVAMGVGLILFWPALFFLAGSDHADELGRLKGEAEAIERASIEKSCGLSTQIQAARAEAEAKAKAAEEAGDDD